MAELAERAYDSGIYTQSEFLTMAEQDALLRMKNTLHCPFTLEGGHPSCERRVAVFGTEELCGYAYTPDICCVKIAPRNEKFSDDLSHRDFLGALMNLGIRREPLGDIFIKGHSAYLFCLQSIAPFVAQNLDKVKHTSVKCTVLEEVPQELEARREPLSVNVPSERIDAVMAAVWKLSRSESSRLFAAKKVFVNSMISENTSYTLKSGDTVSVRGLGKFIYQGQDRSTKKGRMYVSVDRLV
ncbi:MAG: hypothetical protein E7559_10800 [Ruminococcaceae bacterium]|nr:hypothetical protein [Oscillospiraceae bacterium]